MATKGYFAKFFYAAGVTEVANVISIAPPSIEVDDIDVSTMHSTGQWRESISGFKAGGDVAITAQYAKAVTDALLDLVGTEQGFVVEFADDSEWEFTGYIKSLGDEVELEGIVTNVITMMITGVPTFTPSV